MPHHIIERQTWIFINIAKNMHTRNCICSLTYLYAHASVVVRKAAPFTTKWLNEVPPIVYALWHAYWIYQKVLLLRLLDLLTTSWHLSLVYRCQLAMIIYCVLGIPMVLFFVLLLRWQRLLRICKAFHLTIFIWIISPFFSFEWKVETPCASLAF